MFAEHLGWFRAVGGGYSTCPARKAEQTAFPDLCTMCGPSPWSPRCFVVYWVLTKALAAYSSVKRAPLPWGQGEGPPDLEERTLLVALKSELTGFFSTSGEPLQDKGWLETGRVVLGALL